MKNMTNTFLIFVSHWFIYMNVLTHACVHMYTCGSAHVFLYTLVLPFHCVGPIGQTQVIRLSCNSLYPLKHLACPTFALFKRDICISNCFPACSNCQVRGPMQCGHYSCTVKGNEDFTALGEGPSLSDFHSSKCREVSCTA